MNPLRTFRARHHATYRLVVMLLLIALGFGAHAAYDTARGASICRVADPEQMCWTAKHAAYEFRHGHYTRSHGVPFKRVYAHPARAKAVWLHKIDTWLTRHPRDAALLRQDSGRHTSGSGGISCPPDVTGLACNLYYRAMYESSCVSDAPSPTADPAVCHIFDQPYIDMKTLKQGGTLFFCGGAVFAGVVTKTGTALWAGFGAMGCGWGLFAGS